jgi:7-cyano-7-deazaguanine synthase
MKNKSIVLLSGGLDSVVNFKQAYDTTEVCLIITYDYGQKAYPKEKRASQSIAEKYQIPHKIIGLDYIKDIDTGLTKGNIPDFDKNQLDNYDYAIETAKSVWVQNRNGIMINIAAAYADKQHIDQIIVGFNKEEGATFPDNTPEFIDKINGSLYYSTLYHPNVLSYTIDINKIDIIRMGREINAPFEYVWSCYFGDQKMCGKCESCQRLKRALKENQFSEEFIKINKWGFQ